MARFAWPKIIFVLPALWLIVGCEEAPPSTQSMPSVYQVPIHLERLHFVRELDQGIRQARDRQKPLLLFFAATWCPHCHELAEESFSHPKVEALSKRFVCVLIDADEQQTVCEQFQVHQYPTVLFLSPQGSPINTIVGKRPAHELVFEMQTALQSTARRIDLPPPSFAR